MCRSSSRGRSSGCPRRAGPRRPCRYARPDRHLVGLGRHRDSRVVRGPRSVCRGPQPRELSSARAEGSLRPHHRPRPHHPYRIAFATRANFLLDRVLLQPQYRDNRPFLADLTKAYADGTLDPDPRQDLLRRTPRRGALRCREGPGPGQQPDRTTPSIATSSRPPPGHPRRVARQGRPGRRARTRRGVAVNGENTHWGDRCQSGI